MNMKSVALVAALAGIAFGCSSSTDPDKVRCKSDADCTAAGGKAVCEGGYCAVEACTEGYADCDQQYSNGCEVDLGADSEHCGDCATACGSHSFCDAKACACEKGYGDCNGIVSDGCETVTDTDAENCGKCGNVCPAVTNGKGGCNKGKCGVGECDRGWGDCDGKPETGCEYNVSNDVNNCGGCGDTCGGVIGADVTCKDNGCTWACKDGYGDCDDKPETGCETDISANVEHCGECNNPCPAFANAETSCRGSKCEIGNCNEGYRDCDGQPENGCEWNLSEKCAGLCGGSDGCGGTCPDSCVAPETCGGGGTPNVCGCKPKCDGKCGGPDGCGGECVSTCVAPQTCGGGGTQFVCGCMPECSGKCDGSDSSFAISVLKS